MASDTEQGAASGHVLQGVCMLGARRKTCPQERRRWYPNGHFDGEVY